jgi:hypothetical protein
MIIGSFVSAKSFKYINILILFLITLCLIAFGICEIVIWDKIFAPLEKVWITNSPISDVFEHIFHCQGYNEEINETIPCFPKIYDFQKNQYLNIGVPVLVFCCFSLVVCIYGMIVLCKDKVVSEENEWDVPLYFT